MNDSKHPLLANWWTFKIDGEDLGHFDAISGLGCTVQTEQIPIGGNQLYSVTLSGRLNWQNLSLTRPLNADSEKVVKWLTKLWKGEAVTTGTTAELKFWHPHQPSITYHLKGVVFVSWTGPSGDHRQASSVATETLQFAYQGLDAEYVPAV